MLDLDACMDLATSGQNRKAALFGAAKEARTAITFDVWKQVKKFDPAFADELKNSDIEIIDCDEVIYRAVETLAHLLVATPAVLNGVEHDKLPVLALVACAQDGTEPKCILVSGDNGSHKSSMCVLAAALKITTVYVAMAF